MIYDRYQRSAFVDKDPPPLAICGKSPLIFEPPKDEAVRYDDDKDAYHLIPANALHELVKVYSMGAKKYAPRNWEKGMAYSWMFGSLMRHAWAFWRGEDYDSESGLHHMAHVAWNAIGIVEFSLKKTGQDDRPGGTI